MNGLWRWLLRREGCIGRRDFWAGQGIIGLVMSLGVIPVIAYQLALPADTPAGPPSFDTPTLFLSGLGLLLSYPALMLTIKRLHDMAWPGWWALPVAFCLVLPTLIEFALALAGYNSAAAAPTIVESILFAGQLAATVGLGVARGADAGAVSRALPPRLGRRDFWLEAFATGGVVFTLVLAVGVAVVAALAWYAPGSGEAAEQAQAELLDRFVQGTGGKLLMALGLLLLVVLTGQVLRLVVARLHDRNRSGWWLVMPLAVLAFGTGLAMRLRLPLLLQATAGVAVLAALWLLAEILILPGTRGDNAYGADPLGPPPAPQPPAPPAEAI
jgi:uncharacterized membrane protein YhaH (DUF805 family)